MTAALQPEQQTALQMCDNFLDELHDILKEYGESEDYRFVEAVADLYSRGLLWKERPDVRSRPATPAPMGCDGKSCRPIPDNKICEMCSNNERKQERERVLLAVLEEMERNQGPGIHTGWILADPLFHKVESLRGKP